MVVHMQTDRGAVLFSCPDGGGYMRVELPGSNVARIARVGGSLEESAIRTPRVMTRPDDLAFRARMWWSYYQRREGVQS